ERGLCLLLAASQRQDEEADQRDEPHPGERHLAHPIKGSTHFPGCPVGNAAAPNFRGLQKTLRSLSLPWRERAGVREAHAVTPSDGSDRGHLSSINPRRRGRRGGRRRGG